MNIKYFIPALFILTVFCACATKPVEAEPQKKIVDFENYRDEAARGNYDLLRVQVNKEELLYRPVQNVQNEHGGLVRIPDMETKRKPFFTINEEYGAAFAFNSDELSDGYKEQLREIAAKISSMSGVRVRIEGYTDSIGSSAYNLDLSTRRARAVADYLAELGVKSSIISYIGHGKNAPVASNETEAGRAKNRRVEIHVFNAKD